MPTFKKWNHSSPEKWLILGQGQGKHKMSQEHLIVPEIRKHPKEKNEKITSQGHFERAQGSNLENLPMVKAGTN